MTAVDQSASVLRGPAGQFLLDTLPVEADDPGASDLDNRHPRLTRLAYDVPCGICVALDVDLLERNPMFFEVALRSQTPRTRRSAEQHHPGHITTSESSSLLRLYLMQ